ncbi:glycosyltransferase family 4 protein [Chloroflexota bacterium]
MKPDGLKDKTLALFFTCGISLKIWHDIGMIDREVALYKALSKNFNHIYLFTWGGQEDLRFQEYLANNITIVPKKYVTNSLLYSLALPFVHRKILKHVDIIKTNQMYGSWSAALAKLLYRNMLVVRTGYTWSLFFRMENTKGWRSLVSKTAERFAYRMADAAITSSWNDYNYVEQRYHPHNHIHGHNYVDTELFKPINGIEKKKDAICFIGRLNQQKNLNALFDALKGLSSTLDIIGSGPQLAQLKELARHNNVKVNFLGNIPNSELPAILNKYELFVLTSLWEGMPKTLLEAMACGLPVVGTNVDGIKEVIRDGDNGILCDTTAGSIRQAIIKAMNDRDLREKLGAGARNTIKQSFSLDKLLQKELDLYSRILDKHD